MRTVQTWTMMEKEMLVVEHIGLVQRIARKFRDTGLDFDDLVQEGTLGLMKAVETFDPERGVPYSGYAGFMIERYILKYLKRERRHHRKGDVPMDADAPDPDAGTRMGDLIGYDQAEFDNVWKDDILRRGAAALTEDEKEILWLYYGQGVRQQEIGRILGISQPMVSRRLKAALMHMRQAIDQ